AAYRRRRPGPASAAAAPPEAAAIAPTSPGGRRLERLHRTAAHKPGGAQSLISWRPAPSAPRALSMLRVRGWRSGRRSAIPALPRAATELLPAVAVDRSSPLGLRPHFGWLPAVWQKRPSVSRWNLCLLFRCFP